MSLLLVPCIDYSIGSCCSFSSLRMVTAVMEITPGTEFILYLKYCSEKVIYLEAFEAEEPSPGGREK